MYGATPEQWQHFSSRLGLMADLLPVVSNPKATISPESRMKALGKTPSIYNRQGQAAGISKWTGLRARQADVTAWSAIEDYGICIQTRHVRAIDIDIADEDKAQEVVDAIGIEMPVRFRENSGKRLLIFQMEGEHPKRVIRTAEGAIEFLGNGQQFIAIGTHPSGVDYKWDGGLPEALPHLDPDEFESLFFKLEILFGDATIGKVPKPRTGANTNMPDAVASWLMDNDLVLDETDRGLVIACPWDDEHTGGDPGDGSTMWLPAGTRGEPLGHFRCLHAHCEHRTRGDYLAKVGYAEDVAAQFPVMATPQGEDKPLPAFDREKNGAIKGTIGNVAAALGHRGMTGFMLGFDTFRDEIMHGPGGVDGWQSFSDVDYVKLRIRLEGKGFNPIGREMIRDAVDLVARANVFDSAALWLDSVIPSWDGKPRVASFLRHWWGAEDTPYTTAVSRYLWTALAGRVLEPGCKADMVPIFIGPQGSGKSTGVARLAPNADVYAEISLHEKEDDLSRRLKGRVVVELGELRGLHTRELEAIKAWITRRVEHWVPKYKEFATTYARRCVFFGTTNQDQFLADTTGERRWLPVKVGAIGDFSGELPQLWAEAREMFRLTGVAWQAEDLAAEAHAEHRMTDPLEDAVRKWLETEDLDGGKPLDRDWIAISDVFDGVGLDARKPSARSDQMRIGEILRVRFGYERKQKRVGDTRVWVYLKKSSPVTITDLEGRDN